MLINMITKSKNNILERLENNEEFLYLEDMVVAGEGEDFMVLLSQLKYEIMEEAYLEGYKDGITDKVKQEFLKDPAEHLNIIHVRKLLEDLGIKPGE